MSRFWIRLRACFAVSALCLANHAGAASFIVSTGPAGNTYDVLFRQFSDQCQDQVGSTFVGIQSSGSTENLESLLNNDVVAAIVQTDVLQVKARSGDMNRFKALFTLYPEEVHIVALRERRFPGIGGFFQKVMSWFKGQLVINKLSDLRDQRVGAWGGSVLTAQNLSQQLSIPFEVVEVSGPAVATSRLNSGDVDAVIAVGGSPLAWAQSLDSNYKLLAADNAEVSRLKDVYRLAQIHYAKLASSPVQTVSTDALVVTRDYQTCEMVTMLDKIRSCLRRRIEEMREKPGNHAKWQGVNPYAVAQWPMYRADRANCPRDRRKAEPPRRSTRVPKPLSTTTDLSRKSSAGRR